MGCFVLMYCNGFVTRPAYRNRQLHAFFHSGLDLRIRLEFFTWKFNFYSGDLMSNNNSPNIQLSNRILYPDILRIVAIFAVIILHISAAGFIYCPVLSYDWHISNFYECFVRWGVPVFVMVSGMFFLNPQKEITLSKLYRKNIFRIVLAIIFWGILYRSLNVLKVAFVDKADVNTILMTLLKEYSHLLFGPVWYHLWFLYMIIGLYMLVPLLRIFTQNAKEEHYRYLFIIFILFGSILPLLNETLSLVDSRLNINFEIKELLGFSVYCILGYYLSKFEISRKTKLWIYILAAISILFQIIGTSIVSWKLNVAHQLLYKNYTPNVAIQATAVFLIIKDMTPKIHFSERAKSIIFTLSRYSFGIYLVHALFNQFFSKIGFTPTHFNPLLTIPLRAIITFLLSFLIIWVLDKIPIIRKYCI